MTEYKHQPQAPAVLKVEAPAGNPLSGFIKDPTRTLILPKLKDESDQKQKPYVLPTRMNVIRFVQDILVKHFHISEDQLVEDFTEENLLKEYDQFFNKQIFGYTKGGDLSTLTITNNLSV